MDKMEEILTYQFQDSDAEAEFCKKHLLQTNYVWRKLEFGNIHPSLDSCRQIRLAKFIDALRF